MLLRDRPQPLKIALHRRNATGISHNRLQDHAGDFVGMGRKSRFDNSQVIERQRHRQLRNLLRHPRRARNAKRRNARAGFDQQAVGVAVIAAFKLDDALAASRGARHTDRRHGSFRAGTDEAQPFDSRITSHHQFRQVSLSLGRGSKAGRVARRALNRLDRRRKGVAENHRPPRAEVVDVAVSVRILQPGALGARDKRRFAAHRAKPSHRRVHAAGKKLLGPHLQSPRSRLVVDRLHRFGDLPFHCPILNSSIRGVHPWELPPQALPSEERRKAK